MSGPGKENPAFADQLRSLNQHPLKAEAVQILQMNVGRQCNLTCRHCHLEAGPVRTEMMPEAVFRSCLDVAQRNAGIVALDITGGSPEMNLNLEWFLAEAVPLGKRISVRTNLGILLEPAYEKYLDLYTGHRVDVIGSLPDYHARKADRQRGAGNFEKAIEAVKRLNHRGYAQPGSGLTLDLVHNPAGAYLPGSQTALEQEYRVHLQEEYGVQFSRLFSLVNMPLGRYLDYLIKTDNYEDYVRDLVKNFNTGNIPHVMCRTTLSVGWDGRLYDCDFNQSLDLTLLDPRVREIARYNPELLKNREIAVAEHCYGCTVGAGSSCRGCFE